LGNIKKLFMNRTFHFLIIDIILILILLWVYYYGGIEDDRSMSICLLGTFILSKFILNAIHMKLHPFKCGLEICV
jgi:hypothetical protein